VILGNSQWPMAQLCLDRIVDAENAATPGSYVEVDIPFNLKTAVGFRT
jgi:hypothetical protein